MGLIKCQILSCLTVLCVVGFCGARPVGFSYAKFSGPVSGPEKEVYIQDEHGGHGYLDYVAKPDYQFSYGVEDPKSRVLQNRKETRNGDAVQGEYSVVDPDGTLRVVRYTADKINGFQAEVITNGKSSLHGHDAPDQSHNVHHTPVHHVPPPPPVQHESYGRHEDNREQDSDENEEEDDDDDDDGY